MNLEGRAQTKAKGFRNVCSDKNLWHSQAGSATQCRRKARSGYQFGRSRSSVCRDGDLHTLVMWLVWATIDSRKIVISLSRECERSGLPTRLFEKHSLIVFYCVCDSYWAGYLISILSESIHVLGQ